jgi:hypothetical protein
MATGVPYFAPLAFLVTCLLAWEWRLPASLAWIFLFHFIIPCVLNFFGLGLLVVFPDIRGFVVIMMASTIVAQVALALLTRRLRSLTERWRDSQVALLQTNEELQCTLAEVKELRGFLPICAWCKDIRDVTGNWEKMESYITRHSHATFTHGLCPKCLDKQLRGVRV